MKSFKTFTEEQVKEITFAFGRFQPPTGPGHDTLFSTVAKMSSGGAYRIYTSQTQDPKKNPLPYKLKVKYLRDMFPKHARHIMLDNDVKTALDVMFKLYAEGYTKVNFIVCSDRIPAFQFLKKYNGVEAKGKYYNFPDGVNIVSAGDRDPDSDDDVTSMSASKLRAAVANGDFKSFERGMPSGYRGAQALFNDLRKGMNLEPLTTFAEHIQLPPVSNVREKYIRGEIFNVGDKVKHGEVEYTVKSRGPNFVVVEETGRKFFLTDLSYE